MDPKLYVELEKKVSGRVGSYQNLLPEALLSSEADFNAIFDALEITSWCELGCGYGLGTLLFSDRYPQRPSFGIEFELARINYAREEVKRRKSSAHFIHADLMNAEIPHAQTFFLYFPTGPVLDRILFELGRRKDYFQIVVIESHGDFLNRLKNEAWLEVIQEIPLSSQRHYQNAVVFRKVSIKETSIFDLSFQENHLLIRDHQGQWLGDTFGLEFFNHDSIQLKFPPRTISLKDIVKVFTKEELPPRVTPFLQERRDFGSWRKVYLYPEMLGETPDGRLIKLV